MTDLEQAQRDVQEALALVDAAVKTLNEAHARLRALAGGEPALTGVPMSVGAAARAPESDRRYTPGPLPPVWRHVSKLAERLGVHETTAWRIAFAAQAQWPYGSSRKVDMTRFPTLPDTQKQSRLAT